MGRACGFACCRRRRRSRLRQLLCAPAPPPRPLPAQQDEEKKKIQALEESLKKSGIDRDAAQQVLKPFTQPAVLTAWGSARLQHRVCPAALCYWAACCQQHSVSLRPPRFSTLALCLPPICGDGQVLKMWRETAGTDGKDITPEDLRKVGRDGCKLACLPNQWRACSGYFPVKPLAG